MEAGMKFGKVNAFPSSDWNWIISVLAFVMLN